MPGALARVRILLTKLHRPSVTESVVERPRLHVPLRMGVARSLTLVAAPAGYGKTTLVARQLAMLPQPSAWLSLDVGDNDPATFARYLVIAVQSVTASVSVSTRSLVQAATPHLEPVLLSLINDLAALPHDLVVVLDDYHLLTNPEVHRAMAFMLDHLPPLLHFVIVTREDPPFPLAKLRARRQLVEIRAADLSFTREETADFLYEQMGLVLRAEDVARLGERTEGWIAGLHLAALSLQQHGAAGASAFVAAFSGSNRFVIDYLLDEVIAQLPTHTRTFLLSTSILERLCGPLCDAVLDLAPDGTSRGSSHASYSQDILVDLERRHLFLIPLDDERRWYRYHHLFAEVLRVRLINGALPEAVATLHGRASRWYEQQGLLPEAIEHALAARAWDAAALLIEQIAPTLFSYSTITHMLTTWLATLPEAIIRTRPRLALVLVWLLIDRSEVEAAGQWMAVLAHNLPSGALTAEDWNLHGEVAATHAFLAGMRGDSATVNTRTQEALHHLHPINMDARAIVAFSTGLGCVAQGDVVGASAAFAEAATVAYAAGRDHLAVMAIGNRTYMQRALGALGQVITSCRQAIDRAGEWGRHVTASLGGIYISLADVLYERNDLDGALRMATEGITKSREWGNDYMRLFGYCTLARIHQARGDVAASGAALHGAQQIAQQHNDGTILRVLGALEIQLRLMQGTLALAIQSEQLAPPEPHGGGFGSIILVYTYEYQQIVPLQLVVAQGRALADHRLLQQALTDLDQALHNANSAGIHWLRIKIQILRALALHALGDTALALTALEHALTLAAPEGYVRIFVDEGAPMRALLHTLKTADPSRTTTYRGTLLAAFTDDLLEHRGPEAQPARSSSRFAANSSAPPMLETLTERETHVLRLLAGGASNQAIADHLVISLPTAKKHVANILGKLQVHNRTEAIARARALHLL